MSDVPPNALPARPAPLPAELLFEDADLIVVMKPEGIAAIPERDLAVPSVQRLLEDTRSEKLFVVHRLDKEVSGLLIFARNATAHRALSMAFERREVHKRYLALAWGELAVGTSGEVALPIHTFGSGRMGVDARGKAALTRWTAWAAGSIGQPVTLLELSPHTGRRHQLRVHAYAMGHALVGDPRYGDATIQKSQPRLALHAFEASLTLGAKAYAWRAPLPASFLAMLATASIAAPVQGGAQGSSPNVGSS